MCATNQLFLQGPEPCRTARPLASFRGQADSHIATLLGIPGCHGSPLFPVSPDPRDRGPAEQQRCCRRGLPEQQLGNQTPMPTVDTDSSYTTVNGVIYAIGGLFNQPIRTVEAWTPASNTLVIWGPQGAPTGRARVA